MLYLMTMLTSTHQVGRSLLHETYGLSPILTISDSLQMVSRFVTLSAIDYSSMDCGLGKA